jgi:2-dehydropantoate 2-reductase
MRIAIMGTGDIGMRYGAALVMAGEDVTFIARSNLEKIHTEGITLHSTQALSRMLTPEARERLKEDTLTLRVKATNNPAEVGPVDLLMFCVKTYDLEAAAAQAKSMVGPDTVVIPVQNGVGIAERLTSFFGDAVVGGTDYAGPKLIFGELGGGTSQRTQRILDTFKKAGFTAVELNEDIQVPIWEKFVTICATSGVCAVTRLPKGPIWDCPETKALWRGVMDEAHAVAIAKGIRLADDLVESLMKILDTYPPTAKSSQLQDIEAGRRLEIEDLSGAAVRLGKNSACPRR